MKLNKLSGLLWEVSPNLYFLSLVLAMVSGFSYGLLIPLIMYGVKSVVDATNNLDTDSYSLFNSPTESVAIFYFFVCVAILFLRTVSTALSTYIASKAQVKLRKLLCSAVDDMSYRGLMELGQSRLVSLINLDIPSAVGSAIILPMIWTSTLTIIGILAYLLNLDVKVFIFVILVLFIAAITYQIPLLWCARFMAKAREHDDVFQEGVKGLIYGVKELKLNRIKANNYLLEEISQPNQCAFADRVKGYALLGVAENYGSMIAFFVIAIAVFHLPYRYDFTASEIFGIALALIYLSGPVGAVLNGAGQLPNGTIALKKIQVFLDEAKREDYREAPVPVFSKIRIDKIGFTYNTIDKPFILKNICLELNEGQITFLVGGNGSGKSTLSKILTLHQEPTEGSLYFGDTKIDETNILSARSYISAIYSDYYLFPNFYEKYDLQKINHYLGVLRLSNKVEIQDGKLSTIDLSDGQRKRLALLFLLLEDRKICLFDEWAADQDPEFKKIFYEEILVELKNRNKIVIVVSHDDRYFNVADKVIVMEQGEIRSQV